MMPEAALILDPLFGFGLGVEAVELPPLEAVVVVVVVASESHWRPYTRHLRWSHVTTRTRVDLGEL